MTTAEPLSISDVSAAFGLPISTLRYYDSIGLAPASQRRGRVRYYDRADLRRLAYVQLWHTDGALGIERTRAIIGSSDQEHRNAMIERSRRELAERIARLTEADEMLRHVAMCRSDDHTACPIVGTYLDERVETTLARDPASSEPALTAMSRVKAGLEPTAPLSDPPDTVPAH